MEGKIQKIGSSFWIKFFVLLAVETLESFGLAVDPDITDLRLSTPGIATFCIEYDDLNPLKKLIKLYANERQLQFFTTKDCSASTQAFDARPLDLPKLTLLNLSKNKLTIMPDFSLMPALEKLILEGNMLNSVPSQPFTANTKLVNLNLGTNGMTTLPSLTGSCSYMISINLQGNEITSIPNDYFNGCIKLQTINLADNKLISFDHSLCHVPHQVAITMSGNNRMSISDPYGLCPQQSTTITVDSSHCDKSLCWLKSSQVQVNDFACADGRMWSAVPKGDVCTGKFYLVFRF